MTENEPAPDALETLTSQIKQHPGLALAGGLVLGVLASVLLPRFGAAAGQGRSCRGCGRQ